MRVAAVAFCVVALGILSGACSTVWGFDDLTSAGDAGGGGDDASGGDDAMSDDAGATDSGTSDGGHDGGTITLDLTPTTGTTTAGVSGSGSVGYIATFAQSTTITGIEINESSIDSQWTFTTHVWDTSTGAVLATGTTIVGAGGSGSVWYHSNLIPPFSASPGTRYWIGYYAARGEARTFWNNITLPFNDPTGRATVIQSCEGCFDAGDMPPICSCVLATGLALRLTVR